MDKEVLNKFMTEMLAMLQSAGKFTMEQLPLVAKEVLAYNMAISVFWTCVGLALGVVSVLLFRVANKMEERSADDAAGGAAFISILCAIGTLLFLFLNIPDIIKIYFAPRLYLIEYFAQLVHTVK